MKPIRKAVIPAAGYGTRFLPATKSIPKEMIPIVDKPVILTPDIFEILRRVQPNENGEIRLADALKIMASRQAVYTCQIEGKHYDVGNQLDYLKATVECALRRENLGEDFKEYLKERI